VQLSPMQAGAGPGCRRFVNIEGVTLANWSSLEPGVEYDLRPCGTAGLETHASLQTGIRYVSAAKFSGRFLGDLCRTQFAGMCLIRAGR
jgi:hypothetical protein